MNVRKALSLFNSYLVISISFIGIYFIALSMSYSDEIITDYALDFKYTDPSTINCDYFNGICIFNTPLKIYFSANVDTNLVHPVYEDTTHFSKYIIDGEEYTNIHCENENTQNIGNNFVCIISELPPININSGGIQNHNMMISFFIDSRLNRYNSDFNININAINILNDLSIIPTLNNIPQTLTCDVIDYGNSKRCIFKNPNINFEIQVNGLNNKLELGELVVDPTFVSNNDIVQSFNCNHNVVDSNKYECSINLKDITDNSFNFNDLFTIQFKPKIYYKTNHNYYTVNSLSTSQEVYIRSNTSETKVIDDINNHEYISNNIENTSTETNNSTLDTEVITKVYVIEPSLTITPVSNLECVIDIDTHKCEFTDNLKFYATLEGVDPQLDISVLETSYSFLNDSNNIECNQIDSRKFLCNSRLNPINANSTGTSFESLTFLMKLNVYDNNTVWGPYEIDNDIKLPIIKKANIVKIGDLNVELVSIGQDNQMDCEVWARSEDDIMCYFTSGDRADVLLRINGLENVDQNGAYISNIVYTFDGKTYEEYGLLNTTLDNDNEVVFSIDPEPLRNTEEIIQNGDLLKEVTVTGVLTYSILGQVFHQSFHKSMFVKINRLALSNTDFLKIKNDETRLSTNKSVWKDSTKEGIANYQTNTNTPGIDTSNIDLIKSVSEKLNEYDKKIDKYKSLATTAYTIGAALTAAAIACCMAPSCSGSYCALLTAAAACALSIATLVNGYVINKIKETRAKREQLYEQYRNMDGTHELPKGSKVSTYEEGWFSALNGIIGGFAGLICFSGISGGTESAAVTQATKQSGFSTFTGTVKGLAQYGKETMSKVGWSGFLMASGVAGIGSYAATGKAEQAGITAAGAGLIQYMYANSVEDKARTTVAKYIKDNDGDITESTIKNAFTACMKAGGTESICKDQIKAQIGTMGNTEHNWVFDDTYVDKLHWNNGKINLDKVTESTNTKSSKTITKTETLQSSISESKLTESNPYTVNYNGNTYMYYPDSGQVRDLSGAIIYDEEIINGVKSATSSI